ncbi:MAG: hypothetical protein H0T60_06475 [Acidobacteria bacterium]|nr:hypothetical protein [Acidobacteriota bacterium]
MRRTVTLIILSLSLCAGALAQQQPKGEATPAPAEVFAPAEAQKAFDEARLEEASAFKEWKGSSDRSDALHAKAEIKERITALFDIAEARRRHDVAAQAVLVKVYFIMAQLKLSPDEYRAQVRDGRLVFVMIPKEESKQVPA